MKKAISILIIIILFTAMTVQSNELIIKKENNLPAYFNYRDIDGVDYNINEGSVSCSNL